MIHVSDEKIDQYQEFIARKDGIIKRIDSYEASVGRKSQDSDANFRYIVAVLVATAMLSISGYFVGYVSFMIYASCIVQGIMMLDVYRELATELHKKRLVAYLCDILDGDHNVRRVMSYRKHNEHQHVKKPKLSEIYQENQSYFWILGGIFLMTFVGASYFLCVEMAWCRDILNLIKE